MTKAKEKARIKALFIGEKIGSEVSLVHFLLEKYNIAIQWHRERHKESYRTLPKECQLVLVSHRSVSKELLEQAYDLAAAAPVSPSIVELTSDHKALAFQLEAEGFACLPSSELNLNEAPPALTGPIAARWQQYQELYQALLDCKGPAICSHIQRKMVTKVSNGAAKKRLETLVLYRLVRADQRVFSNRKLWHYEATDSPLGAVLLGHGREVASDSKMSSVGKKGAVPHTFRLNGSTCSVKAKLQSRTKAREGQLYWQLWTSWEGAAHVYLHSFRASQPEGVEKQLTAALVEQEALCAAGSEPWRPAGRPKRAARRSPAKVKTFTPELLMAAKKPDVAVGPVQGLPQVALRGEPPHSKDRASEAHAGELPWGSPLLRTLLADLRCTMLKLDIEHINLPAIGPVVIKQRVIVTREVNLDEHQAVRKGDPAFGD